MKCDFCSKPLLGPAHGDGWIYKAKPFIKALPGPLPKTKILFSSDEGWLACDECAILIDSLKARELLERSAKANFELEGITDPEEQEALKKGLAALHAEFWSGLLSYLASH